MFDFEKCIFFVRFLTISPLKHKKSEAIFKKKKFKNYESDISFSIRPSGGPGRCTGCHIVGL